MTDSSAPSPCPPERLAIARPFVPDASEVARLMGYPAGDPSAASDAVRARIDRELTVAGDLIDPGAYLCPIEIETVAPQGVRVAGGPWFASEALARIVHGCRRGVVSLATVGQGIEHRAARLQEEGDLLGALIADAIGSAAVEALQRAIGQALCERFRAEGRHVTRHYSPGYSGWPLEDQRALFELWASRCGPPPVRLTDAAMMIPRKSLSALWGIADRPLEEERSVERIACAGCDMHACDFRRVPYVPGPPAVPVAAPPPATGEPRAARPAGGDAAPVRPPLRPVRYEIAERTLAKWANLHLSIESEADGARRCRFRFLGSTCSNGGTPIASTLNVRLKPAPEGWVFERGWIEIAADDPGLRAMCEYGERKQAWLDELTHPPDYCGRTLEEVLEQVLPERDLNVGGCFCRPAHRDHKWRMALSTIHFALLREATQATPR